MAKHLSLVGIKGTSLDEAYNRVLREAMLLSPRQVRHVNYDAERAATVALGTAKRLSPFKAELSALPRFPAERLEHLEDYALALYSAHLRCNFHSAPTDELTALSEAGSWWRRVLLADANSLAVRQHLRMEQLRVLRRSHGNRNIAHDLAGLAQNSSSRNGRESKTTPVSNSRSSRAWRDSHWILPPQWRPVWMQTDGWMKQETFGHGCSPCSLAFTTRFAAVSSTPAGITTMPRK
ncbi:MAG: hypothetical protein QM784_40405 [Polyangiaceae bacterium]